MHTVEKEINLCGLFCRSFPCVGSVRFNESRYSLVILDNVVFFFMFHLTFSRMPFSKKSF